MDYLWSAIETPGDFAADEVMRPFDFLIDDLAQVMEQPSHFTDANIRAQFSGDGGRQHRDLDGVIEHVLAVTGAEVHAPNQLDQIERQIGDIGLNAGAFAFLQDNLIDLLARLDDHLLNARGMDAAIQNQLSERHTSDLAPHRIESCQNDGLWRVVDDDIHAGRAL